MEIYQIKAFVAVTRLGNLTKAAEALHLTQPAVTAQIKAVEHGLGVALFDRSGGRMTLTQAGKMLLPKAERLLEAAGDLQGAAAHLKGEIVGVVEIGVPGESPEFFRIGRLSANVRETMPLVELRVRSLPALRLADEVRTGRLAACFYIGLNPPRDLQWISLRSVGYRVAIPSALAPAMRQSGWAALAALPWLDGDPESHSHLLLRDMFEQQGLSPNVILRSDDTGGFDALVKTGSSCALLREDVALRGAERNEWMVWGHARIDARVYFAVAREQSSDPTVIALLSVVQDTWEVRETGQ